MASSTTAEADERLARIVDQCASLRSRIDELSNEKRYLEGLLTASGRGRIDGTLHTVTITRTVDRAIIDWQTIAKKLEPSRQLVQAHTRVGEPFWTVRYSARKLHRESA